jgi:hypothetical protein
MRGLRALPIYAAIAVLGYGLTIAAFSSDGFPDRFDHGRRFPFISDKPLGEDSFYMIAIGWNLGTGRGFTYGGASTTGTQPLMTLAYGAIASIVHRAGGDRWTMARAALAFNVLLFVVFGDIVFRLARVLYPSIDEAVLCLSAAAVALFNATLFRIFTYGLETGLYLIAAAACVLVSLRTLPAPTRRGAVALGVAAGMAALARIDFAIVFALFVGANLARRRMRVLDAIVSCATATVIVAPWLLWVHATSGHWIPSSGESQFGLIGADGVLRSQAALRAVVHQLSPWFYPPLVDGVLPRSLALHIGAEVALIALAVVLIRAGHHPNRSQTRDILTTWTGSIAVLLAVYVVAFWPRYFYPRYFAVLSVVTLPTLAAALAQVSGRRGMVAFFTAMGVGFAVTMAVTLHRGATSNELSITAHYINANIDRHLRVGEFSSGVSGYFFDNVINLDGKVNAQAMTARRAGALPQYIDASGIRVVVDWPQTIDQFLPGPYFRDQWMPCPVSPPPASWVCLERR